MTVKEAKIVLKWSKCGLIVHPKVSFRVEKGRIYDIDGVFIDIPGPINSKLTEIQFRADGLLVKAQTETVLFDWHPIIKAIRKNAALFCALAPVDAVSPMWCWAYNYTPESDHV